MIPVYKIVSPAEMENLGFQEKSFLGRVRKSPREIRDIVAHNSMNGKSYKMITANCQLWVIKFLRDTDPRLLNYLHKDDIKPVSSTAVGKLGKLSGK